MGGHVFVTCLHYIRLLCIHLAHIFSSPLSCVPVLERKIGLGSDEKKETGQSENFTGSLPATVKICANELLLLLC